MAREEEAPAPRAAHLHGSAARQAEGARGSGVRGFFLVWPLRTFNYLAMLIRQSAVLWRHTKCMHAKTWRAQQRSSSGVHPSRRIRTEVAPAVTSSFLYVASSLSAEKRDATWALLKGAQTQHDVCQWRLAALGVPRAQSGGGVAACAKLQTIDSWPAKVLILSGGLRSASHRAGQRSYTWSHPTPWQTPCRRRRSCP